MGTPNLVMHQRSAIISEITDNIAMYVLKNKTKIFFINSKYIWLVSR